jgi:hypothetical protein
VYELIEKKDTLLPELPEDLLYMFIKKNKNLEELIERFDLQMEI